MGSKVDISNLSAEELDELRNAIDERINLHGSTGNVLKQDVNDLLNQIVVKLENVPELSRAEAENYSYNGVTNELYLGAVKSIVKRVLRNDGHDAIYNEQQYYNSNCY